MRFQTEVTGAEWYERTDNWRVTIHTDAGYKQTLTVQAVIWAVGQFSNPVVPDIEGANNAGAQQN